MLVVETIARIRRAHLVQGKSIKAICRELRVSRKVVCKVLRSEATDFHYEREQEPMPRLGAWRDELGKLLAANEARPSRERLTLMRVFEALRGSGYEGGYDAVRRYARTWRRDQVSASAAAQRCAVQGLAIAVGDGTYPPQAGRQRRRRPADGEDLAAVLSDGLTTVEAACAEALREATHSADVVINILARHREPAPPVTILTPDALRLTHAPVADCARYDSLRRPI